MLRTLLAVGLVLVLAMGLSWPHVAAPRLVNTPAAGSAAERVVAPAATSDASSDAVDATAKLDAERSPAPVPVVATGTKHEEPTRWLRGRVVLVEADGRERDRCDGTMTVAVSSDQGLVSIDCAVVAGGFEVGAPLGSSSLVVEQMALEGRPAKCLDEVDLNPVAELLLLRATFQPTLRLRVLGEDTGADLSDITVVSVNTYSSHHPLEQQRTERLRGATSPLELVPTSRFERESYSVKARGYAWRTVHLSTVADAEREVRLLPGGDVDLILVGPVPRGARLRVRSGRGGSNGPAASSVLSDLRVDAACARTIDGLPAGELSFHVEVGRQESSVSIAHTTATVVPGETTAAMLVVRDEVAPPESLSLRGTLVVPVRWGRELTLDFKPHESIAPWVERPIRIRLSDMRALGGDRYAWGDVPLVAGRWQLSVDPCQHWQSFEVGPGEPPQLDVVVSEPCELRVRLVEAASGLPIEAAKPCIRAVTDGSVHAWFFTHLSPQGDGAYTGLAPVGRVDFIAGSAGHQWAVRRWTLAPGVNEFVLLLDREQGVEVELRDGEALVPLPPMCLIALEHTETKSGVAQYRSEKVSSVASGEHWLRIGPVDGFREIPPRKVQIEPGQWTKVVIQLERAR